MAHRHEGTGIANVATVKAGELDEAASAGSGHGPDFVQSLERGLAVIRAFGPERPQLTLTEVARATGLTRAAARRFLLTLVELGYVRADGRDFSLRPRVLELGYAYLSCLSLPEVAQVHIEALVARVHESSSISVLDGTEIVYVVRVPTQRIMTVAISVGTRFPTYCTSMGRVLLAAQPEDEVDRYLASLDPTAFSAHTATDPAQLRRRIADARERGFAIVDQELEDGLRSIAVPIHDASGAVVAAMNLSAHAARVSLEAIERDFLPELLATARAIEDDLRAQGPAPREPLAPLSAPR